MDRFCISIRYPQIMDRSLTVPNIHGFHAYPFFVQLQTFIEKGNDLLEEANVLNQRTKFSDSLVYKDMSVTLKKVLSSFTSHLEESRERIEGTACCYHHIDRVSQLIFHVY